MCSDRQARDMVVPWKGERLMTRDPDHAKVAKRPSFGLGILAGFLLSPCTVLD